MLIRAGFEAAFEFSKPTAVLLMAHVHPSRSNSIREPDRLTINPQVVVSEYADTYGNRCGRASVPAGHVVFRSDVLVEDDGQPDVQVWNAFQHQVQDLPDDILLFLLAKRYCEVDSQSKIPPGPIRRICRRAGPWCKPFATTSISIFALTTCRPPRQSNAL